MKLEIKFIAPRHRTPRDSRDATRYAIDEKLQVWEDFHEFGKSFESWTRSPMPNIEDVIKRIGVSSYGMPTKIVSEEIIVEHHADDIYRQGSK